MTPFSRSIVGGVRSSDAKILYEETTPDTDPLGPENVLIGLYRAFYRHGGCPPPASRHHIMAARSPLTGTVSGESNVGGSWACPLQEATGVRRHCDHGQGGQSPVYLWIHDGGAEIRDARPIWGRDAYDARRPGSGPRPWKRPPAAVIGQAGERLAGVASIPHIGSGGQGGRPNGPGGRDGVQEPEGHGGLTGPGRSPLADARRPQGGYQGPACPM